MDPSGDANFGQEKGAVSENLTKCRLARSREFSDLRIKAYLNSASIDQKGTLVANNQWIEGAIFLQVWRGKGDDNLEWAKGHQTPMYSSLVASAR
jgi:hypothetical protein